MNGAFFMTDITFRQISTEVPAETRLYQDGPKDNKVGPSTDIMPEPIESEGMPQVVLDVLGIEGNVKDLPSEELSNLREISAYLEDQLKEHGKIPSALTMGRKLDEIRAELDMDDQTESSVVLDRLSGVVKGWKSLGFMTDSAQKRAMFMKLAKCKDSKEMHKLVFKNYESSGAWR